MHIRSYNSITNAQIISHCWTWSCWLESKSHDLISVVVVNNWDKTICCYVYIFLGYGFFYGIRTNTLSIWNIYIFVVVNNWAPSTQHLILFINNDCRGYHFCCQFLKESHCTMISNFDWAIPSLKSYLSIFHFTFTFQCFVIGGGSLTWTSSSSR